MPAGKTALKTAPSTTTTVLPITGCYQLVKRLYGKTGPTTATSVTTSCTPTTGCYQLAKRSFRCFIRQPAHDSTGTIETTDHHYATAVRTALGVSYVLCAGCNCCARVPTHTCCCCRYIALSGAVLVAPTENSRKC